MKGKETSGGTIETKDENLYPSVGRSEVSVKTITHFEPRASCLSKVSFPLEHGVDEGTPSSENGTKGVR